MENKNSVKNEIVSAGKQSLVYVLGQALSRIVGFFMIPIYTNFIAPKNYGAMELIEILIAVVGVILACGVEQSMSRFYYDTKSIKKRNTIVSTIILGFSIIGLPIVILLVLCSNYFSQLVISEIYYQNCIKIALITVWFGILNEIGLSYLRMRYMAKLFVFVTISQLIISLSLNIYFIVFLKLEIFGIFLSTFIAVGIISISMNIIILKKIKLNFNKKVLIELIKFGLPLIPVRLGLMIGFVSNRYFLRWLGAPDPQIALAMVGVYSLGAKFATIVNRFVTVPFNAFWNPRRMELLLSNDPIANNTISKMCTYSSLITIYIALGLSCGIEDLIKIISNERYHEAFTVVPFISLAYVVLGLETHFMTGIIYSKKTKYGIYVSFISVLVVLLWNYIFVPRYGIIGAATSILVAFMVRVTLLYIVSQKLHKLDFEIKRIVIMIIVSILIYMITKMIKIDLIPLSLVVNLGIASSFPIVLLMINFFSKSEIEYLKEIYNKVKDVIKKKVVWI